MSDEARQPEIVRDEASDKAIDAPAGVAQPAKLLRLGAMLREMLEEIRRAPLDEQGRERMRQVHDYSVEELSGILSPELREELRDLAVPFSGPVPTESELRIAQAQLMGWLEGLFHGIQAALWAQHMAAQQQATQFPRRMPPGQPEERSGRYL